MSQLEEPPFELPEGDPNDWPLNVQKKVLETVAEMDVNIANHAKAMAQSLESALEEDNDEGSI